MWLDRKRNNFFKSNYVRAPLPLNFETIVFSKQLKLLSRNSGTTLLLLFALMRHCTCTSCLMIVTPVRLLRQTLLNILAFICCFSFSLPRELNQRNRIFLLSFISWKSSRWNFLQMAHHRPEKPHHSFGIPRVFTHEPPHMREMFPSNLWWTWFICDRDRKILRRYASSSCHFFIKPFHDCFPLCWGFANDKIQGLLSFY